MILDALTDAAEYLIRRVLKSEKHDDAQRAIAERRAREAAADNVEFTEEAAAREVATGEKRPK